MSYQDGWEKGFEAGRETGYKLKKIQRNLLVHLILS